MPPIYFAVTEAELVERVVDERKRAIDLHLPDMRQRFGVIFGRMGRYFIAVANLARPAIPDHFRISSVAVPTPEAPSLGAETTCPISIVASIEGHSRRERADLFIRAMAELSSAQHAI
jgi:hypothetical protein